MNIRFQRSGLQVGDDQAKDVAHSIARMPDVEIPGSNAGEGGQTRIVTQSQCAALNSSGLRVGGEAAKIVPSPNDSSQPSGTPSPRSRADVAAALTRSASRGGEDRTSGSKSPTGRQSDPQNSAGNGGGEQAISCSGPNPLAPAAKSSGRKIGAGETKGALTPSHAASPRKISRRKVGASAAARSSITSPQAHPGDNSGRKVGDERATRVSAPIESTPAVQISGASASGDEASTGPLPSDQLPRRKSPGRKAGADPAGRVSAPNVLARDPQISGATRGDESQTAGVTHTSVALIAELVQLGRARRDWMKTRVGIELRAIAICRRFCAGDKDQAKVLWKAVKDGAAPEDLLFAVGPLLGPIASLQEQETRIDRQMTKLAGKHEMAPWAKAIRGFGHAGLAKVIAECGDVGSYRGPACVWKRMGLAVINGGRQRRVPGAEALEHGYNAERRSVMWNVGGAVIGGMGKGPPASRRRGYRRPRGSDRPPEAVRPAPAH